MLFCLSTTAAPAELKPVIYDEAKVPKFTLPDPLRLESGEKVTDAKSWTEKRRPELFRLFETDVYGRSPARPAAFHFSVNSVEPRALEGKATRKEVTLYFSDREGGPKLNLLIYLPNQGRKPAPVFIGLNFNGNHTVTTDPGVTLAKQWSRTKEGKLVAQTASESTRGQNQSRWPIEKILARGYGVATGYYGDIEPDFAEGFDHGVRALFKKQNEQKPDDWGAIGAWAWGLSRALDYLETDRDVDAKRVAVMGHSRLGKTALWAGASDPRFAIVISNDSGCGGAALSRRKFGETVERINHSFPHWFCGNFKKYNDREEDLPIDQHELIALMAPRPVYVASAKEDLWADPLGEFSSAKDAEPVYRLFAKEGLGVTDMPAIDQPVGHTIGYHIRTGKHDVTDFDWEQYLAFADRHFQIRSRK